MYGIPYHYVQTCHCIEQQTRWKKKEGININKKKKTIWVPNQQRRQFMNRGKKNTNKQEIKKINKKNRSCRIRTHDLMLVRRPSYPVDHDAVSWRVGKFYWIYSKDVFDAYFSTIISSNQIKPIVFKINHSQIGLVGKKMNIWKMKTLA